MIVASLFVILAACASGQTRAVAPTPAVGEVEPALSGPPRGYYRQPSIGPGVVVFVAEGDLWKVSPDGGVATRLTSHHGDESSPAVSPDGKSVAFVGEYEGPTEVYVMPISGGLPERLTFDDAGARSISVSGWTPDGRILASTDRYSTLPSTQLTVIDPRTRGRELLPLAQAAEGAYEPTEGATLIFTRIPFNGSWTKRYKGGTIEQLWSFREGDDEARPLTTDFPGTSKRPMWWNGRVYFLTDRDGTMNVWSMRPDGGDLRQHTSHDQFDIMGASLGGGRIVYQRGADIRSLDLATGQTDELPITLDSDLDQLRERWVTKPVEYVTSAHLSPEGDKVVLTARGRVFVAPVKQGRIADAGRDDSVRMRNARFLTADKVVALSDKSGEVELWTFPANGVGAGEQLTTDGKVLRWDAVPSPDGAKIAHHNKDQELWILDVASGANTRIDRSDMADFDDIRWSPDGRWLAYVAQADNMFRTVRLYSLESGQVTTVTTDRYDSYSPAWSADGKWLYFLSDRTLRTVVGSPWGANQPDPFLDETTTIFGLALQKGQRWPFAPADEVHAAKEKAEKDKNKDKNKDKANEGEEKDAEDKKDEKAGVKVEIDLDGIATRLFEAPVKAGNYSSLSANKKGLFWTQRPSGFNTKQSLQAIEIKNDSPEVKTVASDVASYELSGSGEKMLIRKGDSFHVVDASPAPANDLDKNAVDLAGWTLSLVPRQQWKQMYIEAWRLMRDYFYDPNMHGVDWRRMLDKYMPLAERVTTRAELSDVLAQLMGELSALHHFVRGGDLREGQDQVQVAALGGVLERDEAAGGWRITRIYQCEPDDPERVSPLAKPGVDCAVGDVIETIDGVPTLSVPHYSVLLRQKAGKQVLVRIRPAGGGDARDAIVVPIGQASESDLRYTDWEYSRRQLVEELGEGKIGYLHLRAMGGRNFTEFVKGFYPVFNREGLIIDVRHNRGGNIDSWILSKLLRPVWAHWAPRVGNPPTWNMQYGFRGHMVMIVNEQTSSDGETVAEGFRRLGLGKVIGTRTWGGGIWLTSSNVLVDRGIASASEFGVFGAEDGQWMIEGHGIDPDVVVDNPPHRTFKGEDAQLIAAIEHLKQRLREEPIPPVVIPARPDKSVEENR